MAPVNKINCKTANSPRPGEKSLRSSPSFSFLFGRKEKTKEAKRKEKPDKSIYLKVAGLEDAKMVNPQKVSDILRKTLI